MNNSFVKMHGLGNEYIVLDESCISFHLNQDSIRRLCNVNFGIGSDGVLLKMESNAADFKLKIFNPDGSEAEKSGNGLRIFSKYLFDYGYAKQREFSIETKGGIVNAKIIEVVNNKAKRISVDMGPACFDSANIPVSYHLDEVIDVPLDIAGKILRISCVSMGNPHCVILLDELDIGFVKYYGPLIENHSYFPNRTNVQFVKLLSHTEAEIMIWERGAGFTLASGSSACAVASVLKKMGFVDNDIKISMLGGTLMVQIDDNWNIRMTGDVRQIAEGVLSDEFIFDLMD